MPPSLNGTSISPSVSERGSDGVVYGTSDITLTMEDSITREQFAAIMYRCANNNGYDTTTCGDLANYTDVGEISSYASDAVAWAVGTGLIVGRTETTLAPNGTATGAEVATILRRYVTKVVY